MINIVDSDRGKLTAINLTNIDFIPKRLFIVDNVPQNGVRGEHAHLLDHQILYCLSGSLSINKIYKLNNNIINETIILNRGDKCQIPSLTWTSIKFIDPHSSLLCLCSEIYDENEYIRNFDKFIRIINNDKL